MARRPRIIVLGLMAASILAVPAATAAGAANPSGTGQPNQSCEEQPMGPAGFATAGFAHAQTVYAGSGSGSVDHAGSTHAVSQYDVACFQLSQR